jgi:hypothetical protein
MSKGLLAGDNIAMGMEQAFAGIHAAAEAKRQIQQVEGLVKRATQAEEANAGNLAEKHALREALRKVDPKHPLLTNIALQEKIKEAGRRALEKTNNYDSAREAGTNFQY